MFLPDEMPAHVVQDAFRTRKMALLRRRMAGRDALASCPQPPIYRFDTELGITMPEALHNVLILGGTGRGKTESLVAPMVDALLGMGLGGLIIDVKNTFARSVRKLAATHGREGDIVEIGTHPSAEPVNLLAGMELHVLRQMLEDMLMAGLEHTNSVDWHLKGAGLVQDCATLLTYLHQDDPDGHFAPSLALLSRMITNVSLAQGLWRYWNQISGPKVGDKAAFHAKILHDEFHVLHVKDKKSGTEWNKQVTWQLSNPRKVLGDLERGILAHKLSAGNVSGVKFNKLILEQNKIVLLRFSAQTGAPGQKIARMIKELFYSAVYSRFDHHPPTAEDRPVFCILDEFQDILHLSESSSLDDFGWFSKAREFKAVNIVATQSMSSLYRPGHEHRVRAMLSNFGSKIIMQTDDPATDEWVKNFFEAEKPVQKLGKGQAIVAKYALPQRDLLVRLETVHKAFKHISAKLAALPEPQEALGNTGSFEIDQVMDKVIKPDWVWEDPRLGSLYDRYRDVFSLDSCLDLESVAHESRDDIIELMENVAAKARENGGRISRMTFKRRPSGNRFIVIVDKGQDEISRIADEWFLRVCTKCGRMDATTAEYNGRNRWCITCLLKELERDTDPYYLQFLRDYNQHLSKPINTTPYPQGWNALVQAAMESLLEYCKNIIVSIVCNDEDGLNIIVDQSSLSKDDYGLAHTIINEVREASLRRCSQCGTECESLGRDKSRITVCGDCAQKPMILFEKDEIPF